MVLAGALAGLAVEFHWLGWTSIPGGRCRGDSCPEGTWPTLIVAFVLTFTAPYMLLGWTAVLRRLRPGRVLPAVLAARGVLLALWPGWRAYVWLRGPVLDVAWTASADRTARGEPVGNWALDGMVVRARTDALVATAASDGRPRWSLAAPDRRSVCAMSATAPGGTGLVAFAAHGRPCSTVWAVDTATGRRLWERRIDTSGADPDLVGGGLAADAGVAVVLEDTTVRGLGLRDGAERWRARLDDGCSPLAASAARGHTHVVAACEGPDGFRALTLTSFGTADGVRDWQRGLPARGESDAVVVLAADPFTIWLKEEDERGVDAVLTYDDTGRERARIPVAGPREDLVVTRECPRTPCATGAACGTPASVAKSPHWPRTARAGSRC